MTKQVNIGSIKIDVPDYNSDVGKAVEALQNLYERGEVRSLLMVCTTKTGAVCTAVGDYMTMPFVALTAEALAARLVEDLQSNILGPADDDGDD